MRLRPWMFPLVLSAAAAVAACSSSGSGSGPAASGSPAGSGAPSPGTVAGSPASDANPQEEPGVKVVQAGAEPRARLRYQVTAGTTETLVLEQSRSEGMVGQKPRTLPPSKLTLALSVKSKSPAGESDGSYEVKEATFGGDSKPTGAVASEIQKALSKLIGARGNFVVSDRGHVRKVEPVSPPGADAVTAQAIIGLADSMQVAFVTLPAAAVGPGARWEHTFDSRQSGINVKVVARYELVSITGTEVKLKVTSTQEAAKQTMDLGGGQKLDITGYKTEGTGDITLSTTHLSPRAMTTETKGGMILEGLGKAPKEVKLTIRVDIKGT